MVHRTEHVLRQLKRLQQINEAERPEVSTLPPFIQRRRQTSMADVVMGAKPKKDSNKKIDQE